VATRIRLPRAAPQLVQTLVDSQQRAPTHALPTLGTSLPSCMERGSGVVALCETGSSDPLQAGPGSVHRQTLGTGRRVQRSWCSSRPTASSSLAGVAGHAGGAEAAERRPRGRPSTAGFHQFGPCLRRGSGGRVCPIPAARAAAAPRLLYCLQDSGASLTPDASSSPVECSRSPCALFARSAIFGEVGGLRVAQPKQESVILGGQWGLGQRACLGGWRACGRARCLRP
jgi:hypothetical protein